MLVVLKDVYGLSHEEIAEELGISVAAAKVRLHRGRKRLRDLLYDESQADTRRHDCSVTTSPRILPEAVDNGAAVELSVQRHIETCLRCQAELARYRRMLRGLQLLRTRYLEPAPGLLAQTLAAIEEAGERRGRPRAILYGRRLAYVGRDRRCGGRRRHRGHGHDRPPLPPPRRPGHELNGPCAGPFALLCRPSRRSRSRRSRS